jgi:osmotically-inducible protein OsmY
MQSAAAGREIDAQREITMLILVQTLDHVVYLNGQVSTGLESRAAESVALATPEVTRVVNLISVTH